MPKMSLLTDEKTVRLGKGRSQSPLVKRLYLVYTVGHFQTDLYKVQMPSEKVYQSIT